jgi:tetratricopeptide (TPR) repeat protein
LALAALTAWAFPLRQPAFSGLACRFGQAHYSDLGEALLHGVPALGRDVSRHMPLSSVLSALLWHHAPAALWGNWPAAAAAATALLASCLGALLGSAAAGALALILWLSPALRLEPPCYPQSAYVLLVLLVACLAADRARAPTRAKTALLGFGIGVSLLFRSPLIFLPPLLAAADLLRARRKPVWKDAALLCAASYALLLPWMGLNLALHGRPTPVEAGEADQNVITGALGLAPTVEGDLHALVGDENAERARAGALRWAAGEALRRPGRYARACLARLVYALRPHPWLALAAFAAFLFRRDDPAALSAFLLAVYFLIAHCLMSVQESYFAPLWPLLAALAACPAGRWPPMEEGAKRWTTRLARAAAYACLAPALLLAVACGGLAGAYPARAGAPAALDRAIASAPQDAWLAAQRGARRILDGDFRGAAADLSRAEESQAGLPGVALRRAWALALDGRPEELLAFAPSPEDSVQDAAAAELLRAEILERLGRSKEAQAAVDRAVARQRSGGRVRRAETEEERRALELLGSEDAARLQLLGALLPYRPSGRRYRILGRLLPPSGPAAGALSRRRAILLQDLGEGNAAVSELAELLKKNPSSAKLWSDKGVAECLAGRPEAAAKDLERAIRLEPGYLPAYLTLGALLTEQGRADEARRLYDRALAARGGDAELRAALGQARERLAAEPRSYTMDHR